MSDADESVARRPPPPPADTAAQRRAAEHDRRHRRPSPSRDGSASVHGVRIGHAERDAVDKALRTHHAAGRIDLVEFEDRIEQVYAARTQAELDAVLADLPSLEQRADARPRERSAGMQGAVVHAQIYAAVIGFLSVIWLLTGDFGFFWPIWPALGWGLAVVLGFIGARHAEGEADEDAGS